MIKNILSGAGMTQSPMMQGQMPMMPMQGQMQPMMQPMMDPYGQQMTGLKAALMGGLR